MKVAIDIRPLMERQPGGVAAYTSRMVNALLDRRAHDYALFCNAFEKELQGDGATGRRGLPRTADIYFRHFPNKALNASFAFLKRPLLEDLTGGADAVYLPNLNFAATRLPYIVTVHDLSFERYPRFFSAKQRLWHRMVGPRRLVSGAAAVAAVSEHTKTDIVETYGIDPAKIFVAHPGVDRSYAPLSPAGCADVLKKYGLTPGYFLFLGTIEPRKNIKNVIAAFEKTGEREELVIAGGKGWLSDAVYERAGRSPKRDRIRFIGYVPEADKPALYSAALTLVYPSFYEGFGMPPLEAMACGTPVVTSHTSSLGEVVGDAGLLVDPYNVSEIAGAMAALRDDTSLATELRRRGLERAKKFTWEKSAERLETAFSALKAAS